MEPRKRPLDQAHGCATTRPIAEMFVPRTGLLPLSNRSAACQNGNWKMASRDWHRKTAGSEPKSSKFVARDRTVVAYPAEMTWFLAHPEITVQRRHWLADDAVWIGPVSDPDSLLA